MTVHWIEPDSKAALCIMRTLGSGLRAIHVRSVSGSRLRPYGNCYWNVEAVVEESGGNIVFGWMLYQVSNSFLCAEHHAIWKTPDGRLRDVTAKSHRIETCFVPDETAKFDLDRAPNVKTRYEALGGNSNLAGYLSAYDEYYEAEAMVVDALYSMGYRCETQRGLARGQETLWNGSLSKPDEQRLAALEANRLAMAEAMRKLGSFCIG